MDKVLVAFVAVIVVPVFVLIIRESIRWRRLSASQRLTEDRELRNRAEAWW
jgi:hypothetical protein